MTGAAEAARDRGGAHRQRADRPDRRGTEYLRFPGGCHRSDDLSLVASLGEQPLQWDVISGDAYLRDPAAVARQTLTGVRPGSIVVMHLVGAPNAPATAAALRTILPALHRRGLRPVSSAAVGSGQADRADATRRRGRRSRGPPSS